MQVYMVPNREDIIREIGTNSPSSEPMLIGFISKSISKGVEIKVG